MKKLITASLLTLILLTSTTQAADEGIKVHGHWKFKIYNPDGSFDRKVEFENSLEPTGAQFLLKSLVGNAIFNNRWQINLFSSTGSVPSPCLDTSGNASACSLLSGIGTNTSRLFFGLIYQLDNITTPTKLILNGSFTVTNPSASDIGRVSTQINTCTNPSTQPQPNCSGSGDISDAGALTSKILASPVSVTFGQLVQVTVEISFS